MVSLTAAWLASSATAAEPVYVFTTLAGAPTLSRNDGPAAQAGFENPRGIVRDSSGNVYVADTGNNTIRKITPAGVVSTFAGQLGTGGTSDGTGGAAGFVAPYGLAIDAANNLYVSEATQRIRKITPAGVVTTLAGATNQAGSVDGTGAAARFSNPLSLACDGTFLYIADSGNNTVRKLRLADAVVTTLAGSPGVSGTNDGIGSEARFNSPGAVAVDATGTVYVGDTNNYMLRKISADGTVSTLAGLGGALGTVDGAGAAARFYSLDGLALEADGTIYVSDLLRVRKVTAAGVVTTWAGSGFQGAVNGAGGVARFNVARGLCLDGAGGLLVADSGNACIRQISSAAVVSLFAGTSPGAADGIGGAARFFYPEGMVEDNTGDLFVADMGNHTIRRISPAGNVTTFAGKAGFGDSVDGTGVEAQFQNPRAIAKDSQGNFYVAETIGQMIRKISPSGTTSVFAGRSRDFGSVDGTGGAARFLFPYGVAIDGNDNVYVADQGNHTIRKITPAGVVSTLAGSAGLSGSNDGTGAAARFRSPVAVAVDASGNVYVADSDNCLIRKITAAGEVTTLAGQAGVVGRSDGLGSAATFGTPVGIAVDASGMIFVVDGNTSLIRRVTPEGRVTTLAGVADGRMTAPGVDGTERAASFAAPAAIAVGRNGRLYVADTSNNTIRVGTLTTPTVSWAQPSAIDYGVALSATQLSATANLPGTFTYNFPIGTVLPAGTHTLSVSYSPTGTATPQSVTASVTLTVNKVTPAISWSSPAPITYGTALSANQLNATSSTPGVFTYSPGVGTVLNAGADQTLEVSFTPADATNYAVVTQSVRLTVLKAVAPATLENVSQTYTGTPRSVATKTSPLGLPVSITYDGAASAPTNAGSYAVVVTISDPNYQGSVSGTLQIAKAVVTAKPDDQSKLQGSANPEFTISYTGLVNGETATVLATPPSATSAATSSSAVGTYPISLSGGADDNYTFILQEGTLSIVAAPVAPTITSAASATFAVGQSGTFTVRASGSPLPAFSASGLPSWLVMDGATGVLSGTPPSTAGAPFAFTVKASNGTAPDALQSFTLNVRAADAAPSIGQQPVNQSIVSGGNAQFRVTAEGEPSPLFRWQASADAGATWAILSDGGTYSGAMTATLTLGNATLALNGYRYRCIVSNSAGTIASREAVLTVVDGTRLSGTYFGAFAGETGRWALNVNADNTAIFVAYFTNRKSAVVVHLTIEANGAFSQTGTEVVALATGRELSAQSSRTGGAAAAADAGNFVLAGQITGGAVVGQLTGLGGTFTGAIDVASGSAAGGYYEASLLNAEDGATYAIVAPSGQAIIVAVSATGVDGAMGTVGGNGQLNATTTTGGQIVLTLNGTNRTIAGTLTPAGATTPVSFAGLADGVASTSRAVNIATRAYCDTDDRVTIGGFVVSGAAKKKVLVRAVGPSLTKQGLSTNEILADPTIEVHDVLRGNATILENDNWGDGADAAQITSTAAAVGAEALLSSDTKSAGALLELGSGVYTFVVKGKAGGKGVVLLEVYDADATRTGTNFTNIATRAYARTGNDVAIGGFVVNGNAPKRVLLRALGATLIPQGIKASDVLTDPVIELHDALNNNATIATNDDWGTNENAASIVTTAARIGATPIEKTDTKSAALLLNLQPGVYSFIAKGQNDSSGIVLVEVYDAD